MKSIHGGHFLYNLYIFTTKQTFPFCEMLLPKLFLYSCIELYISKLPTHQRTEKQLWKDDVVYYFLFFSVEVRPIRTWEEVNITRLRLK